MTNQNNHQIEAIEAFAQTVLGYSSGQHVALMMHLGDRLGLYTAMQGQGVLTAAALAEHTGLQERWLLESLRGQAAAGLIEHHGQEYFALSPAGAAVLTDESNPFYLAGFFHSIVSPETLTRITESFSSGLGMSYDAHGANCACGIKRMTGPGIKLLPLFLGRIDELTERLEAGINVIDIGCGAGLAMLELAKRYPQSTFLGCDPSPTAIEMAQADARQAGLSNLSFEVARAENLPQTAQYDLALTLDCIHDMTFPHHALRAIRGALKPEGLLFIADIKSSARIEDNLANPIAPLLYGLSVLYCMNSALSEPNGAGLGTLGFNPTLAQKMTAEAGFTRFEQLDFEEDPFNNYYLVRP